MLNSARENEHTLTISFPPWSIDQGGIYHKKSLTVLFGTVRLRVRGGTVPGLDGSEATDFFDKKKPGSQPGLTYYNFILDTPFSGIIFLNLRIEKLNP